MFTKINRLTVTTLACFATIGTAHAVCPADGATPLRIGPYNDQTTFPLWVQDSEGLALEICPGIDVLNCITVPPFTEADFPGDSRADEKAALSQKIGFGDEGFWASAETSIVIPAGGALARDGQASLVSAVEAAFLPDFQDGNQFPFTRLRLRIDIPQTGKYTVTHPWGQIIYNITVPGIKAINDSFDIPFAADDQAYQGRIGPILTWDTFPDDSALDTNGDSQPDYIGTINFTNPDDNNTNRHAVKGSPCGTNYFRIEGPNIGGQGVNMVETTLFTVTGKLLTTPLPTPLAVNPVAYSRETIGTATVGQVNVFAKAPSQAELSVSISAGDEIPMQRDGSGRFFASLPLTPDPATLPASVTVTANNAVVNVENTVQVGLVDLVTITRADYDYDTGNLTVEAHSSDQLTPPTLTALDNELTEGAFTTNLSIAPPTVTVSSSAGGSATVPVTIIHAP